MENTGAKIAVGYEIFFTETGEPMFRFVISSTNGHISFKSSSDDDFMLVGESILDAARGITNVYNILKEIGIPEDLERIHKKNIVATLLPERFVI